MSTPGDPPIIVHGGGQTVNITFNEGAFPEVAPGDFAGATNTITRVEVVANGGADSFSVDVKDGDATVTIHYE